MEEVKKKMYRTGSYSVMVGLVFLVIALVMFCVGIFFTVIGTNYRPYDPEKGGYATLEVAFVDGPFAYVEDEKGRVETNYWLAYDSNLENEYVIKTGRLTELDIYGDDIDDNDIYIGMPATTIKGKSVSIPRKLLPLLAEYLEDYLTEDEVYELYEGIYIFDATQTKSSVGIAFLVLGMVIGLTALLIILIICLKNASLKKKLNSSETDMRLQRIYQDFASHPDAIYARKLRIAVSPNWLVDFKKVGKEGPEAFALEGMNNAFRCNMVDKNPTSNSYIAIENDKGRFLFAESLRISDEFNMVITYLKKIIAGGQQA